MIVDYIKKNNIEAAIFDMDGTLIDSNKCWVEAMTTVVERHNINFDPDEWRYMLYVPTIEAAVFLHEKGRLEMSPEEFTEETNAEARIKYREEVQIKPGAKELVETLSKMGLKMCIASSTERNEINLALARFQLEQYFPKLYPLAEMGRSKHDPKAFEKILAELGAKASNTILFEDALYSMKTGKSLGMHVVAIKDEFEKEQEENIAEIADIFVENPENLLEGR